MSVLPDRRLRIEPIDAEWVQRAARRLDHLTKPLGSLGRLERLAGQLVGMTRQLPPRLSCKVIITMAADHGIAVEGVSAYPQAVTAQMVDNFLRGGAAINVLARHVQARVVIVDMGVVGPVKPHADLVVKRIGPGTRNFAHEPAMTRSEALAAIQAGREVADVELAKGAELIGTGDMGIGNTTASSAMVAAMTGQSVESVTGRGTGINETAHAHKVRVIERALAQHRPNPADPVDVLAKVGGFEIGGLVGVILSTAHAKRPVVLDGFISGAAALIAAGLDPHVTDYLIASHRSQECGHRAMLTHLGLSPVLDLDMRLGEGTGAALAMPILEAAGKLLAEMATFEEAGVSERAR